MSAEPLVSIVVPVYNAEKHLGQCLDSLLGQTHRAIEVICVDDGSTDGSANLLAEYAQRDTRVRPFRQENAGPGAARNRGIEEARGEYLYFLDADDWCDKTLVQKAVGALERTGADMAALPHCEFDVRVGKPLRARWSVLRNKFPNEVATWRDCPNWIFESFQNFPWNKMLRMSFVRENHLRYQDIYLTEDLMFAGAALVLASGIVQLDEALVYHRMGTGENTMAAKDNHPLDFIAAFRAFKAFLEERQLYEQLQVAYVNWAIGGSLYNLNTLNTYEAFRMVYDTLAQGEARDMGFFELENEQYQNDRYRAFVADLKDRSADEYLFRLFAATDAKRQEAVYRAETLSVEAKDLRSQLKKAKATAQKADKLRGSMEYRVGNTLCRIPRKILKAMRGARKSRKA